MLLACNFTKSKTPQWYLIVQSTTYVLYVFYHNPQFSHNHNTCAPFLTRVRTNIVIQEIRFIFHFSRGSFCHLARKSRYQYITYTKIENEFFVNSETKLILLLPLEMISIKMCHVLWEQFCCSYLYNKAARNRFSNY